VFFLFFQPRKQTRENPKQIFNLFSLFFPSTSAEKIVVDFSSLHALQQQINARGGKKRVKVMFCRKILQL
jgi:hypothetical protein